MGHSSDVKIFLIVGIPEINSNLLIADKQWTKYEAKK